MNNREPPAERQAFAQRLREMRVMRGFRTARSFAEHLEIDENRYTRYERAEVEPDLTLLVHICRALHVTPGALLGFDEHGAEFAGRTREVTGGNSNSSRDSAPSPTGSQLLAIAWSLAEAMVGIEGEISNSPANPITDLRAQTDVYASLIADPFGAISRLTRDRALIAADAATQARVAELARRFAIAATNAGISPPPPRST